jgi:uncharacterized protein with HEPN domain
MRPSKRGDKAYISDLLEACAHILSYVGSMSLPRFVENRLLRDSVTLQLIIIGEASNKLSDGFKKQHPNMVWKDIVNLRNLLVHKYWQVDVMKLWEIVQDDIPTLYATLSGE